MQNYIMGAVIFGITSTSAAYADGLFAKKAPEDKQVQVSAFFNNDFLGDGKDRWRTASTDVSATFGGGDLRVLPSKAFERFQLRLRSEIIAPASLSAPVATDRQYAAVMGLGAFTHYQTNGFDISYGAELVFTGDQLGLGSLQSSLHDNLNLTPPSAAVLNNQIDDSVHVAGHLEVSRSFRGERHLIRPFVEAQAGFETYARVGVDAIFGTAMINDILLRDSVTGHLINHSRADDARNFGFLIGADAAYVANSELLPSSQGYEPTTRTRVRAGVVGQSEKLDAFYGITWMGKEFKAQTDDQLVGSVQLRIHF